MECWPEKYRPRLASVIGASANFGFLFIAVVGVLIPITHDSWRWTMLVGAMPATLALFISLFVPESELWRESLQHGSSKPLREIFAPGLRKMMFFAIVFSAIPLIGTWAAVSGWIPVWVDQMTEERMGKDMLSGETAIRFESAHNPKERHLLLKESLSEEQWQEVAVKTSRAKASIQIVLAIGAILGSILAPLAGGTWGRRPTYFGLCLLSLLSCGYLFRFLDSYDAWFMAVTGVVGAVTASFFGWLPLYLPELFPTRVRATWPGTQLQFWTDHCRPGNLVHGATRQPFWRRLWPGHGLDHSDLYDRSDPHLVRAGNQRKTIA